MPFHTDTERAAVAYELLKTVASDVSDIKSVLRGKADTGHIGLIGRVERIEDNDRKRQKYIGAAVCAAAASMGHTLWKILTTHN